MNKPLVGFLAVAAAFKLVSPIAAQAPVQKVDTVAVVGCLKESSPGMWTIVNASDPVASTANAPPPKELGSLPKGGKQEFRLIGVTIFNLPAHRDHTVVVKGLHIKDPKVSRLNLTSVTTVADTCQPPAPK